MRNRCACHPCSTPMGRSLGSIGGGGADPSVWTRTPLPNSRGHSNLWITSGYMARGVGVLNRNSRGLQRGEEDCESVGSSRMRPFRS